MKASTGARSDRPRTKVERPALVIHAHLPPGEMEAEYSRQTSRSGDLYPSINQVAMTLTATEEPRELAATLDTVTPNFKEFVYRFDDGPWQTASGDGNDADQRIGRLLWQLSPGTNRIEVFPRNAFERDGIVTRAVVVLKE